MFGKAGWSHPSGRHHRATLKGRHAWTQNLPIACGSTPKKPPFTAAIMFSLPIGTASFVRMSELGAHSPAGAIGCPARQGSVRARSGHILAARKCFWRNDRANRRMAIERAPARQKPGRPSSSFCTCPSSGSPSSARFVSILMLSLPPSSIAARRKVSSASRTSFWRRQRAA